MSRKAISPVIDLLSIWHLYTIFRKYKFTIVHTHFHKSGIYGRWAARLAKTPIIVHTSHGLIFQEQSPRVWRGIFIVLEKLAAKCSDLIFSVNREDIATISREDICPPEKIRYLGDGGIGINLNLFTPERFSAQDKKNKRYEFQIADHIQVIGFVGRLVTEKGILELLQAMQIVHQVLPDVRLLIIGPTEKDRSDGLTPEVAQEYNVDDICVFTGMRQDMPDLYSLMDVFVLPSHREGLPRSPMEALAMGVPCILTNIRGCREVVEHGRNGILVPLGDVQALADAIIDLLVNKEKAQRMGEEGYKIARERFDEQFVFNNIEAVYTELLHKKGIPVAGK